jgi:hypothetical protein
MDQSEKQLGARIVFRFTDILGHHPIESACLNVLEPLIKQMISRSSLTTARIDPAKQCRDYCKDDQDGRHSKCKNSDQDRSADFRSIPNADEAKEPSQKKSASNLQRHDQVKF